VVLWRAELRIAEALPLEPKDLDLAAGTIAILHGKGDKRLIVGIDAVATGISSAGSRSAPGLASERTRPCSAP
jgi:hypothetical protein